MVCHLAIRSPAIATDDMAHMCIFATEVTRSIHDRSYQDERKPDSGLSEMKQSKLEFPEFISKYRCLRQKLMVVYIKTNFVTDVIVP